MLRINSINISMRFITLAVLCLLYCLMMFLCLPPAFAQMQRQTAYAEEPPYYVVDAYQTPGIVYRIVNRKPGVFFKRRSGSISSIVLWRGQLYFCSANDRRIYQIIERQERVVFEHSTYIRDVAVDPNGNLYFSEASGAKSDGRIYKLSPRVDELGREGRFFISSDSQSSPVHVRLSTVDGFWAGDFTFDAESNLYLSSGSHIPAFIYRVPRNPNGVYGRPQKVYRDNRGAIKGIAMGPSIRPNMPQDFIYYADWSRVVYRLNIRNLGRRVAFSWNVAKSRRQHLSDIAFDTRIKRRLK